MSQPVERILFNLTNAVNRNSTRRDFEELYARAAAEADQSDALSIGSIWDIAKGGFDAVKSIFDG